MAKGYRELDMLIHQPARLSMLASLAAADEIEFATLRDTIKISDSLLSRYMSMLEDAGYVHVRKGFDGKRPKTWLSLTDKGSQAFKEHVKLLQRIVGRLS